MRSDIDALLQAHNLDAVLITGAAQHNPAMVYLTGVRHMTGGELVKKRGEAPILFYNPMERDEAAQSGLATRSLGDYLIYDLLAETNGDMTKALILRYQRLFTDLGLTAGRVVVYGQEDAGTAFEVLSGLQQVLPGLSLVGDPDGSVLMEAMATKDPAEIERIRLMGQITVEVVGLTADFLTSHRVKNEVLVKADGSQLTIGDVKRHINLWLVERGAENPEDTIFAIGRDSAVPHSIGNRSDPIRLGQTIVYDIFPCEAGGGYYYDFTRTWCLGYAPDETLAVYEDVLAVYRQIMSELRLGAACRLYQDRTCELFEARGHPTIRTHPHTEEGYVHSLGHGVGLNVHERPRFSTLSAETDRLVPGIVITVEPGLYYPERGLGVRLEDTIWVQPGGQMEILAPYPLDLVLPVKQNG